MRTERGLAVVTAALVTALAAAPAPAAGQASVSSTASEGALFLLLPVGAKAVSLGRAMTAMDGVESSFWNPAGLSPVRERQVVLFRGDNVAGTGTALSVVIPSRVGTLAASYFLHDVGSQELRDRDGNFLGTLTVRNHLGVVSAATQLFEGVRAGLSFKLIQFRTSCRGSDCPDVGTTATSYAFDAGVQAEPVRGVRLAGMVAHVGPALQVLNAEQADPLPARIRLAAAYDIVRHFTESSELGGWITVEVQDRLRDPGNVAVYLGGEVTVGATDALFLRAGYVVGDQDRDGTRVGLGLRYERFNLAIAKSLATSPLTTESEPIHVTFAVRF